MAQSASSPPVKTIAERPVLVTERPFLAAIIGLASLLLTFAACRSPIDVKAPTAVPSGVAIDTPLFEPAVPTPNELTAMPGQLPGSGELESGQSARPEDPAAGTEVGLTHHRPDGNRFVSGVGEVPRSTPLDIPLAGEPVWLTAVAHGDTTYWVVVNTDERVQMFAQRASGVTELSDVAGSTLASPPFLWLENGRPRLTMPPASSEVTIQPIRLPDDGRLVHVLPSGDLALGDQTRLAVSVLPQARLLSDETGRILVFTDPTDRYQHGVLGDNLEAGGLTLVATQPETAVIQHIEISDGRVAEGIAPIWVDWNQDGRREIIVTLSDEQRGAQVVLLDESGRQLAAGPAIGRGFRWRHQLAVAPFGPNGEMELVGVQTPHIGGVVEFYRWQNSQLQIVARVGGYTSHVIGSTNLDMAVAGDFDGDGRVELVLPNQPRTELGAIRRNLNGAEVAWTIPVDGVVSSNLAAVRRGDGRLMLGVGRRDGILRLWPPVE